MGTIDVLLGEITAYKQSVKSLSMALKETMDMRDHWESVAVKLVRDPNKQTRDMMLFFTRIEKYLHEHITVLNGKYILNPVAVKKLLEMFPPEVM